MIESGHKLMKTKMGIFVHPDFWPQARVLLNSVDWPNNMILCYADAASIGKMEALQGCGFQREGILRRQMQKGTTWLDVHVFTRWF